MTGINSIPSEIIVIILRKLTVSQTRGLVKWHCGFELLAVCRKWRALALPLVYRYVYINVDSLVDARTEHGSLAYKSMLTTNLGIIGALEYHMYPRELSVFLESIDSPNVQIEMMLRLLNANVPSLQRIASLDIEFIVCNTDTENDPKAISLDREVAQNMAREFVKYVPNVTVFSSFPDSFMDSRQHLYFLNELTKQYASQVCHLKTSTIKLQSMPRSLNRLTNLHLCVSEGHDATAPDACCINPTTLKKLAVEDAFSNTFWAAFAHESDKACINFTDLTSLSINMTTFYRPTYRIHRTLDRYRDSYACQYRILTPNLKSLNIYMCTLTYDMLSSISLPEFLDRLVVTTGKSMIIEMNGVTSNKALKLLGVRKSPEMTAFDHEIALANSVFNAPNLAQYFSLIVYIDYEAVPIHDISWANLSSLTIVWRINLKTIIAVLERTPSLIELYAHSVDCLDYMGKFVLPSLQMLRKDEFTPLNTRLQRISLYCLIFVESPDESISSIIEYLQIRIATIKQVSITTPTTQCLKIF